MSSWADEQAARQEVQAARQEVRAGSPMEWYTVLIQGGTNWESDYPLRGIYIKTDHANNVPALATPHLHRHEDIYGIFTARLVDEAGLISFKEVRGGE